MIEAPQILLNHRLKSLRLPTVLREYGKLAKQAAAEGLDSHDASDPEKVRRQSRLLRQT